jgi:hypothetical protein
MMRPILLCLSLVGVLAGCQSASSPEVVHDSTSEENGEVILRANSSGFNTPERFVVRNGSQWASVWQTAFALQTPVPPRPAVDFATEMVVVAALGARPSGGYGITIDDLVAEGGGLTVFVTATSPGRTCFTTQAFTQPVEMVRVRAVPGPVSFHERSRTHDCD